MRQSVTVASFIKGTTMRYELGVFGTGEHHYEFDSARSALNSFQVATDDPDTFAAWVVEYAEHDMLGFGRIRARTWRRVHLCIAERRQIFPAGRQERWLIGEITQDTLVLRDRVVRLALLAITFAEPEDRGCSEIARFIELADDGLVSLDSCWEIVISLLFKQALL